ncbi:MAG: repair protein [Herminiimonas sp.]|nr:repair protein [Herminiimonas sp.]
MFSAEDHKDLDLTMVDKRDFAPIGYKRINKDTGKEVEWDNIVKAYEYKPDQYVVLSPEDLKRANVKATQTIDIMAFVNAAEVPLIYYEQPYYLTPDKGGDKVYALLRETLNRSGMIAIAQVVIRTKQHLVALIPMDDMILLNTLRYPDELRKPDELDLPAANLKRAGITEKEVQMALSLVKGMTEKWDPRQYHDTYQEDVLALVKKKIKANQTKTITEPEPEPKDQVSAQIIDLMALLKQSVSQKGERGGTRDTPARKAAPRRSSTTAAKSRSVSAAPGAKSAKKSAAPRRARA